MMRFRGLILIISGLSLGLADISPLGADDSDRETALAAMKRAATYYRTKVASHGGYVYHYSLDLKQRWGEGVATTDQVWVQPPGTPNCNLTSRCI